MLKSVDIIKMDEIYQLFNLFQPFLMDFDILVIVFDGAGTIWLKSDTFQSNSSQWCKIWWRIWIEKVELNLIVDHNSS